MQSFNIFKLYSHIGLTMKSFLYTFFQFVGLKKEFSGTRYTLLLNIRDL